MIEVLFIGGPADGNRTSFPDLKPVIRVLDPNLTFGFYEYRTRMISDGEKVYYIAAAAGTPALNFLYRSYCSNQAEKGYLKAEIKSLREQLIEAHL